MDLAEMRRDAAAIFQAALKAVDPAIAVMKHVHRHGHSLEIAGRTFDLTKFDGVYVVGMGKAAAAMAQPIEDLLGSHLKGGVVNVKWGHAVPLKIVRVNEAGHPVPDEAGRRGSMDVVKLLQQTGERDLVLCLISGGGSALLPHPTDGLTLEDKQQVTRILLDCGAPIHDINALRKHISQLKGGRLAQLAHPSTLVSLILSDVVGDDLDTIASGPTVPDRSTFTDCLHILERYDIQSKIPPPVLQLLQKGARGEIEETPKVGDVVFRQTLNVIIANNRMALSRAEREANDLGYHSLILSSFIEGETKEVAKVHTAIAKEILTTGHPVARPAAVISGGETTVTLGNHGLGGRNQEFALAAAIEIDGFASVVILSIGTDGTDGPTDAAGAIADGTTLRRARECSVDAERHLREHDAYHFFEPLGDLIFTGPTHSNVMDLRLLLVG